MESDPLSTFEEEQKRINYSCLVCLLFNVGSKTLRRFFKENWPTRLHSATGLVGTAWCELPHDGHLLLNVDKTLKFDKHERGKVQAGDTSNWDLTILCKILMNSRLGFLHPKEVASITTLREARNKLICHASVASLADDMFSQAWKDTTAALTHLGASYVEITKIKFEIQKDKRDAINCHLQLKEHIAVHSSSMKSVEEKIEELGKELGKKIEMVIHQNIRILDDTRAVLTGGQGIYHTNEPEIQEDDDSYDDVLPSDTASEPEIQEDDVLPSDTSNEPEIQEDEVLPSDTASDPEIEEDYDSYDDVLPSDTSNEPGIQEDDTYYDVPSFDTANEPEIQEDDGYCYIPFSDTANEPKIQEEDGYCALRPVDTAIEPKIQEEDGCALHPSDTATEPKTQEDHTYDYAYSSDTTNKPKTQEDHTYDYAYFSDTANEPETEEEVGYADLHPSYKRDVFEGSWKPIPLSEVVAFEVKGVDHKEWSQEVLFRDVESYRKKMSESEVNTKVKVEQILLHKILPALEGDSRKPVEIHSFEIYRVLSRLSCFAESQATVKHSLHLLLHLMIKDKLEPEGARKILEVEETLRQSLIREDGLFTSESTASQRLRLTVYGRVVGLLVICLTKGYISPDKISQFHDDLKRVQQTLEKQMSRPDYVRKDRLRYITKFILQGLSVVRDSRRIRQFSNSLENYKRAMSPSYEQEINKLVKKIVQSRWFYLHLILCCLEHEVRKDKKALQLLHQITSKAKKNWKFMLTVTGILTNAALTNKIKDIRMQAGSQLGELLAASELKKFVGIKPVIEKRASRALFSPDFLVRRSLALKIFAPSQESVPIERIKRYLCWFYRNQTLRFDNALTEAEHEVVYNGFFLGDDVTVKVMQLEVRALKEQRTITSERVSQEYTTEAYFLRRMNQPSHYANVVRLVCCNTKRVPPHIITEFMAGGNLRDFLRNECNGDADVMFERGLAFLAHLCFQVIEALVFLKSNKILHRKIMAKSVLVDGSGDVCKLSGFGSAKEANDDSGLVDEKMEILQGLRHAAPEVIQMAHFSTASDVWAFGALMFEVFSRGCTPWSKKGPAESDVAFAKDVVSNELPVNLPCFDERVYELMRRCWARVAVGRIQPEEMKIELQRLRDKFEKSNAEEPSKPPRIPPTDPKQSELEKSQIQDWLLRTREAAKGKTTSLKLNRKKRKPAKIPADSDKK